MLAKNSFSKMFRIMFLVSITLLNSFLAISQTQEPQDDQRDGVRMRKITPETYSQNRANPKPKAFTTEVVRKKVNSTKETPNLTAKEKKEITTTEEVASLGFTLWDLRELPKEEESRIGRIVSKEQIKEKTIVAQRVETNPFVVEDGAFVRFSIELPVSGYLYVFDREKYPDGSYSAPYLVYPLKGINNIEDNNYIEAYQLVFLPRQAPKYGFLLSKKGNGGTIEAEEYTFIVSPEKLNLQAITCSATNDKEFPIECEPREIKKQEFDFETKLKQWQAKEEVANLDLKNSEHQKYKVMDKAEIDALSNKLNKLTKDSPPPQTVYTVLRNPSEPYWVSVPIQIAPKK